MKLTRRDLIRLIPACTALTLMIAAAASIALFAQQQELSAEYAHRNAQGTHAQNEQRLRQVRTEEQDIRQRSATLQALQNSGILGPEKRLDWIERLREMQRTLGLPGMKYEFGPQTPVSADGLWLASPLRLQLRLVHEQDLLGALAQLRDHVSALVITRSCSLSRAPAKQSGETAYQLLADCDMQWLTANPTGSAAP